MTGITLIYCRCMIEQSKSQALKSTLYIRLDAFNCSIPILYNIAIFHGNFLGCDFVTYDKLTLTCHAAQSICKIPIFISEYRNINWFPILLSAYLVLHPHCLQIWSAGNMGTRYDTEELFATIDCQAISHGVFSGDLNSNCWLAQPDCLCAICFSGILKLIVGIMEIIMKYCKLTNPHPKKSPKLPCHFTSQLILKYYISMPENSTSLVAIHNIIKTPAWLSFFRFNISCIDH